MKFSKSGYARRVVKMLSFFHCLLVFSSFKLVYGNYEFEAYSLLQYQIESLNLSSGPQTFGSWGSCTTPSSIIYAIEESTDNNINVSGNNDDSDSNDQEILYSGVNINALSRRNTVILKIEKVTVSLLKMLFKKYVNVLILLPFRYDSSSPPFQPSLPFPSTKTSFQTLSHSYKFNTAKNNNIYEVEHYFLSHHFDSSVMFAYTTPVFEAIFQSLVSSQIKETQKGCKPTLMKKLSLSPYKVLSTYASIEGRKISRFSGENIYAWLSPPGISSTTMLPIIAIVAHYDAFAASPHLSFGASSSAGPVAVVMELGRLMSIFYDQYFSEQKRPKYKILFLLSDNANSQYMGSQHAINTLPPKLIESFKYVLCLDNIQDSSTMYLHTAKVYKDPDSQRFVNTLVRELEKQKMKVDISMKKVYVNEDGNLNPVFEHDVFAKHKIPSGTLSTYSSSLSPFWQRSSILDQAPVEIETLTKIVQGIGETLIRFAFEIVDDENIDNRISQRNMMRKEEKDKFNDRKDEDKPDISFVQGITDINIHFLKSTITYLSAMPRFLPYRQFAHENFPSELKSIMKAHIPSTNSMTFDINTSTTFFYDSPVYCKIVDTMPASYEFIILLLCSAYVSLFSTILTVYLHGFTSLKYRGIFSYLFSPFPSRK